MQGYGNIAVRLRGEFGWSKTFFSAGFASTRVIGAVMAPAQGVALGRVGVTRLVRIGAVLILAGFILMATISDRSWFIASLVVVAIGSSLSGFLTITSAAVSWFERRRSRALSYMSMGFALGGFCGPLLVVAFNVFGWRTTLVLAGILTSALCWSIAPFIGVDRIATGQPVDGAEPQADEGAARAEGVQDHHFTAAEAVRTRAFWMITFGHGSALLVVAAVMGHLTLYLTEDRGYSDGRAAVVAGLVPVFQFVGTAVGGPLGDRFNKRAISIVAMFAHGIGLLALTYATGWLMIGVFVALHGMAWGARGPQMNAIRADYFGTTSYGTIMGTSAPFTTLGAIIGPMIAGTLADATGDYQIGFTILAIAVVAGSLFFVLATPPPAPVRVQVR